jgi:hypothetical protein
MFASQFKNVLETHYPLVAQHYKGAFEFDKYPRDLAVRNFILWNSAQALPGEHWRIIYMHHGAIDIFDPLGLSEQKIKEWDLKFDDNLIVSFNANQLQPKFSPSCGWFCLYFAIHRVLNPDLSMRQLLAEDFCRKTETNLSIIKKFFSEDGVNPNPT